MEVAFYRAARRMVTAARRDTPGRGSDSRWAGFQ